jgi:hypothetical protein
MTIDGEWTFVGTRTCEACNGTGKVPEQKSTPYTTTQKLVAHSPDSGLCKTCNGEKAQTKSFTREELKAWLAQ